MAEVIRMPKMSDTMEEGVIATWNVKVGDIVKNGDILAEIETDKATMDMESYFEGVVLHIAANKGQAIPVNGIIAIVGEKDENISSLLSADSADSNVVTDVVSVAQPHTDNDKAKAELRVDLSKIKATAIRMPLLSDTMTEGHVHTWLKKVGDNIKPGDIIAEIDTDKATLDLEAYEEGTLLHITVLEGEAALVNGIIAIVGEKGENFQAILDAEGSESVSTSAVHAELPAIVALSEAPASGVAAPVETVNGRILASPLAKSIAKEKAIDLSQVKGTGENGRIIKADVDSFVLGKVNTQTTPMPTSKVNNAAVTQESYEDIPLTQIRKTIAKRLSQSKFSAPEFYLTVEINMDKAIEARTVMNEASPVKISFNDFVLKAAAVALTKHPAVNSSWMEDRIRRNHHVHIGMAVAIEDGLLVPVIRFADTKPLSVIAAETKSLAVSAKNRELQPKDWDGNTFTVSNLGSFGIEEFTSIINPPESCILAVGGIKEIVAVKNGQFYATNVMKVTLTCDHRVVDGATGAAFLVTLKELLEQPYKLLV